MCMRSPRLLCVLAVASSLKSGDLFGHRGNAVVSLQDTQANEDSDPVPSLPSYRFPSFSRKQKLEAVGKKKTDKEDVNTCTRSWGCDLQQTPLIFIHLGKAGGGSIRTRFAASAQNVTKTVWWKQDGSFYPIATENGTLPEAAVFCNSGHHQFKPLDIGKEFEGFLRCSAATPLGLLGCPELLSHRCAIKKGGEKSPSGHCNPSGDTCHLVYAGHNILGNELSWLPTRYLQKWWYTSQWAQHNGGVAEYIKRLGPGKTPWCQIHTTDGENRSLPRPYSKRDYDSHYNSCQVGSLEGA
jgi:hypothetical protein